MKSLKAVNIRESLAFLFLTTALACSSQSQAKRTKLLIFRAQVTDGSRAHKMLLRSGLRFRRLAKTKMVFIEETDKLLATEFRADSEFSFIEEDRKWRGADFSNQVEEPENDAWVPDFFEDTTSVPVSSSPLTQPVVLAIVDSGIRLSHPYFTGMLLENSAERLGTSGLDDDHNGYVDDVYGVNTFSRTLSVEAGGVEHGTHVASLAVLSIKESHQSAAANVRVLPINFMANGEYGSTSSALLGLEYALNRGAQVVNVSWGGGGIDSYSQALYDAFAELYQHDVLVVAAAGNESNDNDSRPFFPANYNLPNLVSVASVSPEYGYSHAFLGMGLSFFSNFGRASVDVAAPGALDDAGSPLGVLGANGKTNFESEPYVRMMGTSMAAPVVSGVASVIRSLNKNLSAWETKQILLDSSRARNGDLMELKIGAGVVSPTIAYQAAINAHASSANPALPQDTIRGSANKNDLKTERIGGCAQIQNFHGGPPSNGPFGGNSILLLSSAYGIVAIWRRKKSLLRSHAICV